MPPASLGRAALAALLLLTGACDEDPSGPGDAADAGTQQPDSGSGFAAGGTLTPAEGKQVPTSAKLMVVWVVSSTSPDYVYKFGEGTSSGSTFGLPLPTPPPAEALNREELGVGLVVLVAADFTVADGKLEDPDGLFNGALGGAGDYAIIYKAKEQVASPGWAAQFPLGYSCGQKVEAPEGETYDSFAPVSCASINVTVDDLGNIDFANWT